MKVLAAIDLGPRTEVVLQIAARRARESNGALGICHVVPAEISARASEAMDRVVAPFTKDIREVAVFLEQGDGYAEIVRRAEQWGAELVVVGASADPGLLSKLIGGVAERVVRYAHCTVIVARNLREDGPVVAATDLSDPSLPAVEAGFAEASLRGGGFTVVHVLPILPALGAVAPHGVVLPAIAGPDMAADTRREVERRIESDLDRLGLNRAPTAIRVLSGPPAATLVSFSRSNDAELVVVGTRGKTGLARVVLGSVAEEVVRTALSSVMVVRLHEHARK